MRGLIDVMTYPSNLRRSIPINSISQFAPIVALFLCFYKPLELYTRASPVRMMIERSRFLGPLCLASFSRPFLHSSEQRERKDILAGGMGVVWKP